MVYVPSCFLEIHNGIIKALGISEKACLKKKQLNSDLKDEQNWSRGGTLAVIIQAESMQVQEILKTIIMIGEQCTEVGGELDEAGGGGGEYRRDRQKGPIGHIKDFDLYPMGRRKPWKGFHNLHGLIKYSLSKYHSGYHLIADSRGTVYVAGRKFTHTGSSYS